MEIICHIRCNDKYWEKLNVYEDWVHHKTQYNYYKQIIKIWDEELKIPHLTFRKQIRDIIINSIIDTGLFDTVLESNQHCKKYFETRSSENIIFFQQDDDDIFLFLPKLHDLQPGINIFRYSSLDPLGGRRKRGYKIRKNSNQNVQSNQCIIYNTDNPIDINEHHLYEADHTAYDNLKDTYNYHIKKYPFTIQLYHIHSISMWKHQFKFSPCNYTEKSNFLKFVVEYVDELEQLYMNNKNIPQLKVIVDLYKNLL